MGLETLRLLLDFGLVVLIWMVQLVVYPSFLFYKPENLVKWHKKYTKGIVAVVIPLMIGQLTISVLQLIHSQGVYEVLSVVMVVVLWISTFVQFVPLHNAITNAINIKECSRKLVQLNRIRTTLWTLLFILSLGYHLIP